MKRTSLETDVKCLIDPPNLIRDSLDLDSKKETFNLKLEECVYICVCVLHAY